MRGNVQRELISIAVYGIGIFFFLVFTNGDIHFRVFSKNFDHRYVVVQRKVSADGNACAVDICIKLDFYKSKFSNLNRGIPFDIVVSSRVIEGEINPVAIGNAKRTVFVCGEVDVFNFTCKELTAFSFVDGIGSVIVSYKGEDVAHIYFYNGRGEFCQCAIRCDVTVSTAVPSVSYVEIVACGTLKRNIVVTAIINGCGVLLAAGFAIAVAIVAVTKLFISFIGNLSAAIVAGNFTVTSFRTGSINRFGGYVFMRTCTIKRSGVINVAF